MQHYLLLLTLFFLLSSCRNETANKDLTPSPTGEEVSIPGPDSFPATQQPTENPYKNSHVEVKTFKDSLGWGYDIFIDNAQYVHQPHIPAVSGNRGFSSEINAKKTAELVAYKIRNNIMPPSITPGELDSLGVLK